MPEKFFYCQKKKFLNKLLKVLHVDLQLVATYIFNMFVLKFETFFEKNTLSNFNLCTIQKFFAQVRFIFKMALKL